MTKGSSCLATLSFGTESRGDSLRRRGDECLKSESQLDAHPRSHRFENMNPTQKQIPINDIPGRKKSCPMNCWVLAFAAITMLSGCAIPGAHKRMVIFTRGEDATHPVGQRIQRELVGMTKARAIEQIQYLFVCDSESLVPRQKIDLVEYDVAYSEPSNGSVLKSYRTKRVNRGTRESERIKFAEIESVSFSGPLRSSSREYLVSVNLRGGANVELTGGYYSAISETQMVPLLAALLGLNSDIAEVWGNDLWDMW